MSTRTGSRPTVGRQLAAIGSLTVLTVTGLFVLSFALLQLPALLLGIVGLGITVAGGWWIVTERMPRRAIGIALAVLGLLVVVVSLLVADPSAVGLIARTATVVLGIVIAGTLARVALVADLHAPAPREFRPKHPVLIYNRKSGGGKVDTFGLLEIAAAAGVETVELTPGADLEQLARDAISRGADCLGMAGGDGSQAKVAETAVSAGVPFVCIPAGTRNHFALDLGLDRDDPRLAMSAFSVGALRTIDYATVNDRLFVNNVSLGVYATIVQSDDYRDAKLATSSSLLPSLVGRTAEPFDLQFTSPTGEEVNDVFVILVSNNPYVVGPSLGSSQRPSLVTGHLGVVAAHARTGADAVAVLAEATLHLNHSGGLMQFTTERFEVRSRSGSAYAGIDGEALDLPTPLVFAIHPRGLQVLVPLDRAAAVAPQRRALNVRELLRVAAGHPPA